MKKKGLILLLLVFGIVGLFSTLAFSKPVSVSVWTDKCSYVNGEGIRIYISVDVPSYVYVYLHGTSGRTETIYPNFASGNNVVYPGETKVLPDSCEYSFIVRGPAGWDVIEVVAVPLDNGCYSVGKGFASYQILW